MNRLPFFVYGTLRVGFGNHRTFPLGSIVSVQRARLDGASMSTVGFPYVWRTPTGTVVGEVMTIDPDLYEQTVRNLDGLEGYRGPGMSNHYEREVVEVTLEETGETIQAYVYLVDEARGSSYTRVPSGDFATARDVRMVWEDEEDEFDDDGEIIDVDLSLGDMVIHRDPITQGERGGVLIDQFGDRFLVAYDDGSDAEVDASELRLSDGAPATAA